MQRGNALALHSADAATFVVVGSKRPFGTRYGNTTKRVLVHTARRYRERVLRKASRSWPLVYAFRSAKCIDTWDFDMVEVVTRLL